MEEKDLKEFMEFSDIPEEKKIVYIYSGGGAVRIANAMLLRCEREKVEMRLIYWGSMGFDIFYRYTWPKFVENDACGVVHTVATEFHVFRDENWRIQVREDTTTDKQQFKNHTKWSEPYPFLTDKEKKKFRRGGDIYVGYDRLKEIFKDSAENKVEKSLEKE